MTSVKISPSHKFCIFSQFCLQQFVYKVKHDDQLQCSLSLGPQYSSRQWQDEKLSHWYRSVDIKAKFQNNFLLYGSLYVKKKNNLPIFQNCPETFILKFANLFFEKYAKFNFNILENCHKKMIVTKFCETLTTKVKVKNLCFQNLSFVSKPNEYRPENPMLT